MRNLNNLKRVVSGVLSVTLLANFGTIFPMNAFANEEIEEQADSINETTGHRYQLIDTSMSWTEAEEYCESLGGHLVTVNSSDEQQFIVDNLLTIGTKNAYFIGMYRDDIDSDWKWITNESTEFFNWDEGEPSYTDDNYVYMYGSNYNSGSWKNTQNYVEDSTEFSTANIGYICEWEAEESEVEVERRMKNYALFSASSSTDFSYSGWKSNIIGNIYSGSSFKYGGSEFSVTGRVDTVNSISADGWKIEINERNENIAPVEMEDFDKVIHDNAQPYDYYEENTVYIQDLNVIDKSIKISGDVEIGGTTFEGDCYIIADGNITYNVNDFNSTGRVFLYSQNGNITINGTNVNINGGIYAPNGNVSFNIYETNLNGFVWADSITYSGSIFNVTADNFDMLEPRSVVKTYTIDADFNEGKFNGLGLDVSDELTLTSGNKAVVTPSERIYGDSETGKPDTAGTYTIKAVASDPSGNSLTKKVTVTVKEVDTIAPIVTISFDKDTYFETDDIVINVSATDNVGVTDIALLIDGTEVELNAENSYTIKKAELKNYTITAKAYDEETNEGTATETVVVNEAKAPEINVTFDKDIYNEGDSLQGLVTVQGQSEIISLTAKVNNQPLALENGIFTLSNLEAGEYTFTFTAEDVREKTSTINKTITVLDEEHKADERLYAVVDGLVEYGKSAMYKVTASDDIDKSTILVTLNGEKIELTDEYTCEFKGEKLFTNEFILTAETVDGEILTVKNSVLVYETEKPTVTVVLNKDKDIQEHDDIVITITAEDISGIRKIQCLYDGVEIPLDENGQMFINDFEVRPHSVVIRAWDNFGNLRSYLLSFYVVETEVSGGGSASVGGNTEDTESQTLIADIYTPINEDVISCPSYIFGRADGTEFEKYRLEYQSAAGGDYVFISEGTEKVNNGSLGEFDTTMLRNGLYNIKLTVWGKNGEVTSDEIIVSVEGEMKIGNFSLDFQDMDLNVAGAPVTVIRGYDSRDRNISGDFGYGWNLSTCGVTVTKSCNLSYNWRMERNGYNYNYIPTKPHIVSINWGNGEVEKFVMNVQSAGLSSLKMGNISFESLDKNGSTLAPNVNLNNWIFENNHFYKFTDDFDDVDFNPDIWQINKADGTKYLISCTNGILAFADANGNQIKFNKDGIENSDGEEISINRDGNDRITSISSPTGKTVSYEYDENGDLVKVIDISGYETTFEYDNHYLTAIIDPRGVTVSRNIYDDNGRLIKTIDADGNEIVYDHDIDGREETITDRNGGITRYVYDHNGNVTSQTDPMGNTVKNTYDSNGNLSSKTDAMGNVTNYSYDDNGNMLVMTDAEGNTVTNEYNSKGFITSINAMGIDIMSVTYDEKGNTSSTIDALGNEINYSYDSKGNLESVTDEIGTYMNMTYDSKGNVISATNGAGTTAEFTYDSDGNCLSKTLTYTSGEVTKTVTENYTYDESGNLIKIIDSDGNITTTEYNSIGKISVATDEKGRQTSYDYDSLGNVIKITYADGTSESFTYDREGNNLTATDRLGRTVTMKYDKVGNLISKTYPNGAAVKYTYDANYNLTSTISASGNETKYEYDAIGRNTVIIDALGNHTEFTYNSHSQLGSMTDANGNVYTYTYDDNGNRTATTYPDGSSVSSAYDARGRVISQTDQHGYTTSYTYDGADRLTSVTDALGNVTSYTYNEVGNLIKVTDANNHSTLYTYDDFSRVIKTTNALGQTAEVTYDVCGNVLTSTDFGGKLTSFTYDEFDRVIEKKTADGTVTYSYTTEGKLSSVTDKTGTTKYTYDSMDGLKKAVYPNGEYVEYTYDDASRLTGVKTSYGTTSYEYDKLDRLVRVVDRNGYATVYEYDKNGNRSAVRYANGIVITYKYDEVNRLICEKALDKQGGIVAQYEYTLGAAGERTAVKELDRTVEYTYDALYRLTSEKITAADETVTEYTYAYDNVSNRILKTENGAKTVYTYNALNQLVKENDAVYKYDDAGNLISTTSADKSATYTYNAENKLIRATVQEGNNVSVEEYEYDYAGNRISKTTGTETVTYLNDNSVLTNVIAEFDADGNMLCYYTIGADLISQERNGKTSFYLYDGHGSVRGLVDESGKITDTYNYDAFGNLLDKTGTTVNNYLYCGEQLDSTTGLYYLRARYMNPATGTFITQDTYAGTIFDPTSLHKYLYANANPVMYTDPSGYFSLGDFNTASSINSILDNTANMSSQFALKFFKKFMKKVAIGTIGGLIAVGDQWAAGVTDHEQLAIAFRNGFLSGFAFSFASGKVAMALGALGTIGGFAGAVKSFSDGNFWQGVYRLSWSVIGGAGLYKLYSNSKNTNNVGISSESHNESKYVGEQIADLGRKLDYQYGKANGNSHTNDRTFGLLKEMDKLGFSDTPDNRAFFEQYYNDVLNGKNSVIVNESLSIQGRSVWFATTRESFLMGKYGGAKVETVWDGNRLITMIIHSGEQTRYHHVGGK